MNFQPWNKYTKKVYNKIDIACLSQGVSFNHSNNSSTRKTTCIIDKNIWEVKAKRLCYLINNI